ncbi:putative ATP-dependent RNA helicase DHX35 [Blattella germanica]|nr:putative ATP-dependent RNA helicase DHX35 [Blattella germanica]
MDGWMDGWMDAFHLLQTSLQIDTENLAQSHSISWKTGISKYLLEAGWGSDGKIIGVTEPRRVAATTLATRVAEEKGTLLGHTYMTEGILLREMMADPLLRNYAVIMLDEVHERTLYTDIVMGLLKKILRKQKNLKLIVSSATVDAEQLHNFFNQNSSKDPSQDTAVIMSVEGRLYPVDIHYVKVKLLILPMYGSLPNAEQLKVFRSTPRGLRKVVIATNIAETSITIFGIVYVIDCGFVKLRWFNPEAHIDSLVVVPVSQASANQRAGRAGRVRSGKAYRLYSEEEYDKLSTSTPPEMQRTELSMAVLQLKALGIDNVLRFNFPSPPPAKNLQSALELLYALDAIDSDGQLTKPIGITVAEFPISPLYSKALIISGEFGCSEEILSIIAMLQVQNVFTKPSGGQASIQARIAKRKFEVEEGDLMTLLNVFTAYVKQGMSQEWCRKYFLNHKGLRRAQEIRTQMLRLLQKFNVPIVSCEADTEKVCRAITASLFPNAAYLHYSGVYRTVRGDQELHIHPNSVLLLFCEVVLTDRAYMRDLIVVNPSWLEELAPHFYKKTIDRDYSL